DARGHLDLVEEGACSAAQLGHRDAPVLSAVGIAHRVRSSLGDSGEQSLRCERALQTRLMAQAVTGDSAHGGLRLAFLERVPLLSVDEEEEDLVWSRGCVLVHPADPSSSRHPSSGANAEPIHAPW